MARADTGSQTTRRRPEMTMSKPTKLESQIAELADLTRNELVERWSKAHGVAPPKGIKRPILERSAAWHLQARHFGELDGKAKRVLQRLVRDRLAHCDEPSGIVGNGTDTSLPDDYSKAREDIVSKSKTTSRPSTAPVLRPPLESGTRLIREWNGRRYTVERTEAGYVLDGKTWKSLTAIAFHITGVRWSGPRFFAL